MQIYGKINSADPYDFLLLRWTKLEAQVSLYRSPDINKSS
jgi:hypothetical protein